MPLGRSALWLCVGYGVGALLGWLINLIFHHSHNEFSAGLTLIWPLLIGLMGGVLLIIGTMPGPRIAISTSAARAIEKDGVPGVARIRYINSTHSGTFKTVTVSLDVATSATRIFRSELVWKLSAVDTMNLHPGAIIPVRIDPRAPSRVVLDTRASLHEHTGPDPNEVFSVRNRFRRRLAMFRPVSVVATAVGAAMGLTLGLLT